jgi:hypothetical protein
MTLAMLTVACGRLEYDARTSNDGGSDARTAIDAGDGAALDARPPCVGLDEDGDGWPNACDNCPTEPNADQRNAGELGAGAVLDAVGDACDPNPSVGGDVITLAAFHDEPAPDYISYGGTTSYPGNGTLRLGAASGRGSAEFATPLDVTRVEIEIELIEVPTTADGQWFGVWYHRTAASGEAIFAQGYFDPDFVPSPSFILKEQTIDGMQWDVSPGPVFAAGQRYRFVAETDLAAAGVHRARFVDLESGEEWSAMLDVMIPRGPTGYLEARNVVAEFQYLLVYSR